VIVRLVFRTELHRDARTLYRAVLVPENLQREMAPWITMRGLPSLQSGQMYEEVPLGQTVASCPVDFLGIIPIDTWELAFLELAPPDAPPGTKLRFVEASRTKMMKAWRHEREVSPLGAERALLEDQITFETKLPWMTPFAHVFVETFFAHRHRQLAAIY
jgi:hypothetical protein